MSVVYTFALQLDWLPEKKGAGDICLHGYTEPEQSLIQIPAALTIATPSYSQ